MLKSFFKSALRNVLRHNGHSAISIFGLAVGLACGMVTFLYVQRETSYDTFHLKADQIYRVTYDEFGTPAERHLATVAPPMGPALVEEYPQVRRFVRLRDSDRQVFSHGDVRHYEEDFFYADSSFFEVFSFPLAEGDRASVLDAPHAVVLSRATARKYFGDEDVLGRTLTMNDEVDLTVTGVLDDASSYQSHLDFDFLISFSTFRVPLGYPVTLDDWHWISFHTYVELTAGADATALEADLKGFMTRHFDEDRAARAALRLQPVTDVYLGEPKHPEMAAGSRAYVYGLSGAAFLILLLACFNFANLSTAQSIRRSKEVGVRKSLGASKGDLVRQYLGETLLLALFAFMVAIPLAQVGTSVVNRWLDLNLPSTLGELLESAPVFIALAVLTGILAGFYPAYVLSAFRPADVLKAKTPSGIGTSRVRDGLVIGQFAIAIALTIATVVVARQMEYVQSKELGFEEDGLIALHLQGEELLRRYEAIEDVLRQNPHVLSVTKSGNMFDGDQGSVPIAAEGASRDAIRPMPIYSMYYGFAETVGIDVVAGRAPSREMASDSSEAVLLNETAASVLAATVPGWDEPIGKQLRIGDIMEGRVIGVVEDFHFASLHTDVEPLVLYFPRTAIDKILIRVRPGNVAQTLASLKVDWEAVVPDYPFTYQFLDDHVAQLYRADLRFARLMVGFSLLTLIIACLGLYGIAAFLFKLRTKEIGIRKVLGASVFGIATLLSERFVVYGLIANVIAWPLAYVGLRLWLENFAYRIEPDVSTYALAGLSTIAIALITIVFDTIRTASANPVNSLRQD